MPYPRSPTRTYWRPPPPSHIAWVQTPQPIISDATDELATFESISKDRTTDVTDNFTVAESVDAVVVGGGGAVDVTAGDALLTVEVVTTSKTGQQACTTSENIATSESDIRLLTLLRAGSEGPATSMVAARILTEPRTTADAISIAMSVARLLSLTKTSTNAIFTAESVSALKIKIAAATDALSAAMTVSRIALLIRTLSENPVTSMVAARLLTALRAALDALSTSELASRQILHGVILRDTLDTTAISELASRILQSSRNGTDATTINESIIRNGSRIRFSTDNPSRLDIATRVLTTGRVGSELLHVPDLASVSGFTISRAILDALSILDVANIPIGAVYAQDQLIISDVSFWFTPKVVKILIAMEPIQIVRINIALPEPIQINVELL